MATYDFDYALWMLRQAIDFAEMEQDFVPLRKWTNKLEQSSQELEAIRNRLTLPAGQQILLATLQSASEGAISPDDALQQIQNWVASGQVPVQKSELVPQFQFA
jgi:hypothetical protein